MRLHIASLLLVLLSVFVVNAQPEPVEPAKWNIQVKNLSSDTCEVVLTATLEDGWHVYSTELPENGPTPTNVKWTKLDGVEAVGELIADKVAEKHYEESFGMELAWWQEGVTLTQKFHILKSDYTIAGTLEYMCCNDMTCTPPQKEEFSLGNDSAINATEDSATSADSATSVADTLPTEESSSFWYIFIACFIGGFVALLTPCVWPMIPMTVSFFLKKSGSRGKSIRDAAIYGFSIIIIYLLLGLLITAIFGASSLNALSTSAVCNIIFFLLLVVFGISFLGAFEIALPESWSNKIDGAASNTTGLLSIFFMAFTLTLVSFSCTGPIIGTLLVEAASTGNIVGPAIGMFGFSLALAIPFCFFAMFPSILKKLPKSGGWMDTVKVTLGFIELALSLKFLSVADMAYGWHILDREVFISLWVVIFSMLGLYLIGKLTFSHYGNNAEDGIGVFRFFLGMFSFAFAVYLLPGLWGAPLKAASAFVPPIETQDFVIGDNVSAPTKRAVYDDFDEALAAAKREGKPLLVDFSGYGCVNCRKMEVSVLDDNAVKSAIAEKFVFARLMVDDKHDLPQPIKVQENGKEVTLTTLGDKWSYLQRSRFAANTQPLYVILDGDGNLQAGPMSFTESVDEFMELLNQVK